MAIRLDKLLDAWRSDDRSEATVEFCQMLVRASAKPANVSAITASFVQELGVEIEGRHPHDAEVMLALAGLFITTGLLDQAEALLTQATQVAPEDARIKKLMGKVRLHQGIKGMGGANVASELPKGVSFGPSAPSSSYVPPPVPRAPAVPNTPNPSPVYQPGPGAADGQFGVIDFHPGDAGRPAGAGPAMPNAAVPARARTDPSPGDPSYAPPVLPQQAAFAPSESPQPRVFAPPVPSQQAAFAPPAAPQAAFAPPAAPQAAFAPPAAPPRPAVALPPPPPIGRHGESDGGPSSGVTMNRPMGHAAQMMDEPSFSNEVPTALRQGQMPPLEDASLDESGAAAGTQIHQYDDAYLSRLRAAGDPASDGPTDDTTQQGAASGAMEASEMLPDDDQAETQIADLEKRVAQDEGGRPDLETMQRMGAPFGGAIQRGGTARMDSAEIMRHVEAAAARKAAQMAHAADPDLDDDDEDDSKTAVHHSAGSEPLPSSSPTALLAPEAPSHPRPAAGYMPPHAPAFPTSSLPSVGPYIEPDADAPPPPRRGVGSTVALAPSEVHAALEARRRKPTPDGGPAKPIESHPPSGGSGMSPMPSGSPSGMPPPATPSVWSPPAAMNENSWDGTRPAPKRTRSTIRVLVAVALVTTLLGVGVVVYAKFFAQGPLLGGPAAVDKKTSEAVDAALLRGGLSGLDQADRMLVQDAASEDKNAAFALAKVRERALRVLAYQPTAKGLDDAIGRASRLGASEDDLAFARVASAIASGDRKQVRALLDKYDGVDALGSDAYYQLISGIALEQDGDPEAISRFQVALGQEPGFQFAEVRLTRAALVYGDRNEGVRRISSLGDLPERQALDQLAWALDHENGKPKGSPPAPPAPDTSLDVSVATVPSLVEFYETAAEGNRRAALRRGIDGSDVPAMAVLFGEVALGIGDTSTALRAGDRALELSRSYGPALKLIGKSVSETGQLERLQKAATGATGAAAAELLAFYAYERGDAAGLEEALLVGGQASKSSMLGAATRHRREVLMQPLSPEEVALLKLPDAVGGMLVAADSILDRGKIEEARRTMEDWKDPGVHPLRAVRWARLLRYEGNLEEASGAIESAAPTKTALVERVLLEAESPDGRAHALASLSEDLQDARPFLNAYLLARSGKRDEGRKILKDVSVPKVNSGRLVRLSAALAFGELGDFQRGEPLVRPLLTAFPTNPDIVRAAVGLGLLPKSSLTAAHGTGEQ